SRPARWSGPPYDQQDLSDASAVGPVVAGRSLAASPTRTGFLQPRSRGGTSSALALRCRAGGPAAANRGRGAGRTRTSLLREILLPGRSLPRERQPYLRPAVVAQRRLWWARPPPRAPPRPPWPRSAWSPGVAEAEQRGRRPHSDR